MNDKIRTATVTLFLSTTIVYISGCGSKFLDPTRIGRFRPVPAVNVILDSLGVAEEKPVAWEGGEDPRPIDVIAYEADYVFGSGDLVRITIFELLREGVQFFNDYVVTETGKISIPEVGVVEAAGLTETQLEEEIKQILSPGILKDPVVSVILRTSQQRAFSILGQGIPRAGRFLIPRYNFRLADALAVAGGIGQFNISYIYVSRAITGEEAITQPVELAVPEPEQMEQLIEPKREMLEIIAPMAKQRKFDNRLVVASSEMVTSKELATIALPEGFETLNDDKQEQTNEAEALETLVEPVGKETIEQRVKQEQVGRIEWIFQDGRWLPIQIGQPRPMRPEVKVMPEKAVRPAPRPEPRVPEEFGWEQIGTAGIQRRVIRIDADKLRAGDPRYNIVIKPGDTIHVPVDIIGEFCIMGNINRTGFINLFGRPMTLKMAIAAAGGLGPLAWPNRCEVVRRIGKDREEIVMVDLDKIARGEQPDFFIKPNDLINVGTDYSARWREVLRNAFRATYGFGFLYDRNFSQRPFGVHRPFGPFDSDWDPFDPF
jgi:polysaccharide export outer membrane protein